MPVQTPIPDDSTVSILPQGQVDYLSHNWKEEDVWKSWRNMTRQKNEIANGPRLENASWRTWWKQRNKLKTISPETLNWLKDSDVTWLYGPLHTAVEWTPPPKPEPPPSSVEKDRPRSDGLDLAATTKKPILKHRSFGEILLDDSNMRTWYDPKESDNEVIYNSFTEESVWYQNEDHGDSDLRPVSVRPPLVHTKSDTQLQLAEQALRVNRESPPSVEIQNDPLLIGTSTRQMSVDKNKKHIRYNMFVEQCVSIDTPQKAEPVIHEYDEESFEDDDEEEDEVTFTNINFFDHKPPSDEEDEDEVLEIRTAHTPKRPRSTRSSSSSSSSGSSRSRSHNGYPSRPSTGPRPGSSSGMRFDHVLVRTPSFEKEHITIAPIAPTMLKSNGTDSIDDERNSYSDDAHWGILANTPLELVYMPPVHSNYGGTPVEENEPPRIEFSPGLAVSPPSPAYAHQGVFIASPIGDELGDDAYDYFGGPDLGEAFPKKRRSRGVDRQSVPPRYAQHASSSSNGRRGSHSRERRSRSTSRTPSPIESPPTADAPPLQRVRSASGLLSPSEQPSRGRSLVTSVSSDDVAPRGRSITRSSSSSFSDRNHSVSTSSPIGSLSPDGSSSALNRSIYGSSSLSAGEGRGRSTTSSRSHSISSASPDDSSATSYDSPSMYESKTPSVVSSDGSTASTLQGSSGSTATIVPISFEAEVTRSNNPTPSNSPTSTPKMTKRSSLVLNSRPPMASTRSSSDTAAGIVSSPKNSTFPLPAASPERPTDTLVGRAVDMASALLGSMWH